MVKAQGRCASPDGDYCTTKTRRACKDPSPWQERILLQGLVPPKEQWHGNRTAVATKASKSSSPLSSWPCFHHFVALAAHLAAHSLPTSYLAECQKSAPGSHKPSSGLVVIERASARKPPLLSRRGGWALAFFARSFSEGCEVPWATNHEHRQAPSPQQPPSRPPTADQQQFELQATSAQSSSKSATCCGHELATYLHPHAVS